jgi:hypothetical protein
VKIKPCHFKVLRAVSQGYDTYFKLRDIGCGYSEISDLIVLNYIEFNSSLKLPDYTLTFQGRMALAAESINLDKY